MLFGLQGLLISAAVSALLAGGAGYYTAHKFCDADKARAEVVALRTQLAAAKAANDQDAVKAADDATKLDQMKKVADDLLSKIGDGKCLDGADADRLRRLWQR